MDRTGLTIPNSKKTHLHLTPKQRTFAEIFVANYPDITKKKAAEKAGYAIDTCEKWGSLLTNPEKYPHVVSYIESMREKGVKYYKDYLRDFRSYARTEYEHEQLVHVVPQYRNYVVWHIEFP